MNFFLFLNLYFTQGSFFQLFSNWLFAFMVFSCLMLVSIFPLVFNLIFIPNIEKKTGNKLFFSLNVYKISFLPVWMISYGEISFYILVKYLICRNIPYLSQILNKIANIQAIYKNSALERAGYDISMASRLEIIFSFIVWAEILLINVALVLLFFISYKI